jgi:hypothetical protein
MNEHELFHTEDFPLAISLTSLGFVLEAIDKTSTPGRSAFVYRHSMELDKIIEEFWKGGLRVEPRTFFSASKFLKQHLYRDN